MIIYRVKIIVFFKDSEIQYKEKYLLSIIYSIYVSFRNYIHNIYVQDLIMRIKGKHYI